MVDAGKHKSQNHALRFTPANVIITPSLREASEKMGLKGKNKIVEFQEVAERLLSKIVVQKNVAGVVFLGGLTRGFVDDSSDLDVMVFLSERDEDQRKRLRKIGLVEQKDSEVDIDLEVHQINVFRKWHWDEIDRWDFSTAKIVYDPEGQIEQLFKKKLGVPKDFWINRIVVNAEYMKWYCCSPRDNVGTIAETWIDRGDLVAAHDCLNYSVELLIKLIFALNKGFLPPPKWRMFYSYNQKWLPNNYRRLVTQAIWTGSLTENELRRRLKALRQIFRSVLAKIEEETGFTQAEISRHYVAAVLGQI